jgi:hypothetical protein
MLLTIITVLCCTHAMAAGKPLKVYILAGQSNMEGQGAIHTFPAIGDDPITAPLLDEMLDDGGKPVICENVWITYPAQKRHGKLTVGFAFKESNIGPEFTFGLHMQKQLAEPILLIKVAWGGKSLHTDFRPPSAGPYKLNAWQQEHYKKQGHGIPKDLDKWKADKVKATGHYYRLMVEDIRKALKNIKNVYIRYDPNQGYELAGFVWFQGWNDYCDWHTYPNGNKPGGYDLYTELLVHFIRDVRKDLSATKLPFIIGVFGVRGLIDPDERTVHFREAMAAPAAMPEFKGNVAAVPTAPYWVEALEPIYWKRRKISEMHGKLHGKEMAEFKAKMITPLEEALWERGGSNGDYHYLGSAKTFAQIGKAFAEAVLEMGQK